MVLRILQGMLVATAALAFIGGTQVAGGCGEGCHMTSGGACVVDGGIQEPRFATNAQRPLAPVHPAAAVISFGTARSRRASKITATGTDIA
jgi:hypothetical protein